LEKKAENAQKLVNYLYANPIVNLADVMTATSLSKQASNQLIKDFLNKQILVELTGNQRNRLFYFKTYYELFIV